MSAAKKNTYRDLPELARARRLWATDQRAAAMTLFRECATRHPRNPFALVDAARASGQWFDFAGMEKFISKLLQLPKHRSSHRLQAGQTYRMNYRPEKAVELLQRVGSPKDDAFLANLELAVIYERQGQLAEAEQKADAALALQPHSPEATLVLARALHRRGRSQEAATLLAHDSQQLQDVYPDTRAAACSLRAQILERSGDYADALRMMRQSKEALRPLAAQLPPSMMSRDAELDGFFRNLQQEHIDQLLACDPAGAPQRVALMTSFPRSGTTLLETMLGSHPDVAAADELPVFVDRVLPGILEQCGESPAEAPAKFGSFADVQLQAFRATYMECQSQALETELANKLLIDKNPSLTVFIPFFLRVFPELKLLVPLRDPRDVLLSCYSQYLPLNAWSVQFLSLETAAKRFANVLRYWVQMREMIPTSSWLELKYEDLVTESEQQLRRVLEFLQLPWDGSTLDYHNRPQVAVHNAPTYADVRRAPYRRSIGRWRNYADQFEPLRETLEPVMDQLGYRW